MRQEALRTTAFPTYYRRLLYALLEAMAGGAVPVISPVGAIPDVVQDEVHASFVAPQDSQALANARVQLANDRLLLHRLELAALRESWSIIRWRAWRRNFTLCTQVSLIEMRRNRTSNWVAG
jgi:glycosyltransferase involved in cell wall biosynthesis